MSFSRFTALAIATCATGLRSKRGRTRRSFETCGVKGPAPQIVNGEDAAECEWNWQVGLWSGGSRMPFCGGMLINEEWVLTAAHCISEPDFSVKVGDWKPKRSSANVQERRAIQVIQHPRYGDRPTRWDFALARLESPVELNSCVGTVCLPNGTDVKAGQECWITGWGTLRSGGSQPGTLQEAKVSIISNEDCYTRYGYSANEIQDNMICAQGRRNGRPSDACQGDSGGPLVCQMDDGKWGIYGATSWGYGCAGETYPGIWARVASAMDWIDQTLADNDGPPPPPPVELTCPSFAVSPKPDSDGDCKCRYNEYCSTNGSSKNCPTSGSIGGWGGIYFLPDCEECKCIYGSRSRSAIFDGKQKAAKGGRKKSKGKGSALLEEDVDAGKGGKRSKKKSKGGKVAAKADC